MSDSGNGAADGKPASNEKANGKGASPGASPGNVAANTEDANTGDGAVLGASPGGRKPPPEGMTAPEFDHIGVLGHVGWLLSQSTDHRDGFIADLEWRVMPPVALGQYKIWTQKTPSGALQPVAYASWAFLGPRQEARLKEGRGRLSPADWKSGPKKVVIDVIAPFGGKEEVMRELGSKN